ncbi:3-oxoacyl-[acyl-carrier-protein] synthase III C-terminal domain-containing protein [Krasilnikovia sp. MM14-A1259]|uniref:3-oxoacyl-[acyl-carrier-protein] synthase III C-terminal domain-containing protein n=1 Tax=Krasilnikovia sp. MM14-A1259 TaxID=3373539 RepID=UPI00382E9C28
MAEPLVSLDHISWALGEHPRTVEATVAAGGTVSTAEQLRAAGFADHHVCGPDTDAYDLAVRALTPVRERLDRVGAIVYATCLPGNATTGSTAEFEATGDVKHLMRYPASRLQADFGWDDAIAVGVGQQGCTGLLGAVRVARALLIAEPDLDPVVCVTADRFPAGARYEQTYNLVSDGAVGCVVSRAPGRFGLLSVRHVTNGALAEAIDDEVVGSYFSNTCEVVRQACDEVKMAPGEADWLVPQNTDVRAVEILGRLLGLPEQRLHRPATGRLGHVIAGDNLINLAELDATGALTPGQRLVLPVAGYGMNFQCAVLQVQPPGPGF